jgi:hypothetical protein
MRTRELIAFTCAAVTAAGLSVGTASAQTNDERTYFTFNGPVEVPGVALPAGRYMFHLADTDFGRNVMQVMSADGKHVFASFFAVAVDSMSGPDDPQVRFMEAPKGVPPAVKTWWYPWYQEGKEFVYPKSQARRIVQLTHQSVLTTRKETATAAETAGAELTLLTPQGEERPIEKDRITSDTGGRVQKGEVASTAAPLAARSGLRRRG